MILAEQKRNKNIAEYIIYVWQTEDLIRAYRFDRSAIQESIINFLPIDDQSKIETLAWYEQLIKNMESEGLQKNGHLQVTKDVVAELEGLHHSLLEVVKDPAYIKIYEAAESHIKSFQEIAKEQKLKETEVCLNGVYGLLLLRLDNKPVPEDLVQTIQRFGDVLSYLAYKYKEKKSGAWN